MVFRQGNASVDRSASLAAAWPVRTVRAAIVAACTLGLAVTGHILAGAEVPAPSSVAALFVAIWAATACVGGRRLGMRQLIALLSLGQALVHLSCALGTSSGVAANGALMVLFHTLATVATAALLRRGDESLWRLVDLLTLRAVPLATAMWWRPASQIAKQPIPVDTMVVKPQHCPTVRAGRGPPMRLLVSV